MNAEHQTATDLKIVPDITAAQVALAQLRTELKGAFLERNGEIDAILLALLAEEHVLLLGPPGGAKSALTNTIARAMDAEYYAILLTKQTAPEEPFGPLDLPALKTGVYRRVTRGRFPEAEVAMLDEIFKASSAILNTFLTALNEREFDNGGIRQPVPLKVCVGCSNELPQDESLGALFDRFLIRRYTRYVADRDNRRKLLLMHGEPSVQARLSADALAALRGYRRTLDTTGITDALLDIGDAMTAEGFVVSDRRWRKCVKLVQASALLEGRQHVEPDDLLVLADALWDSPDDAAKIYGIIAKAVSPDLERAMQLYDSAAQLWAKANPENLDTTKPEQLGHAATLNRELKGIVGQLKALKQTGRVAEICEKTLTMQKTMASKLSAALLGKPGEGW